MSPGSAEVSGHRLCPFIEYVYSVGWSASWQFPPWEPPEFQGKEKKRKKKNEILRLNFIFLYYLVISSHSGFSSRLPPNAGIVIPKYPQGIKDNLGKEERTELLKYVA